MKDDLKKFKNLVTRLVSQGRGVTEIGIEAGLTWPTVNAIMNDVEQNYRASTMAKIQDFIKTQSVGKKSFEPKDYPEESIIEEELIKRKEDIKPKPEEEPIKTEKEEMSYSEMEFILKMKEFLVSTPRHIKLSITIEKHG